MTRMVVFEMIISREMYHDVCGIVIVWSGRQWRFKLEH